MIALDSIENGAPTLWCVLTTASTSLRQVHYRDAQRAVWRAVQARWPEAEYARCIEATTGYGTHSGGERRPHWNWMFKGVPGDQVDELRSVVVGTWCRRVDAAPDGQYVGPIPLALGLTRYLALHFMKESQRMPHGWRGHRFTFSTGYFDGTVAENRARAHAALQLKRELYKAIAAGESGPDAELTAQLAVQEAAATTWTLAYTNVDVDVDCSACPLMYPPNPPKPPAFSQSGWAQTDLAGGWTLESAQPPARVDLSPAPAGSTAVTGQPGRTPDATAARTAAAAVWPSEEAAACCPALPAATPAGSSGGAGGLDPPRSML